MLYLLVQWLRWVEYLVTGWFKYYLQIKLIDRSSRIIASLAKIPYEKAVEEFFYSYYNRKPEDEYRESYVVETLKRLGFDPNADIK